MSSPVDDFRAAMRAHGLVPPESIIADGRIHRCDVDTLNGHGDGAYLLHLDGIPAGGFQSWQDGDGWHDWCSRDTASLTAQEWQQLREAAAQARKEREVETRQRQSEAAEYAREIWQAAKAASADHEYLKPKGVRTHGLRVYRGELSIGGMVCDGGLIVPLRDAAGELHALEFIAGDGQKRYLRGGRKVGGYFSLGKPADVLVIAEGFATGASIYESTQHATAICFDAGNMRSVAETSRAKFPEARIVLAGDHDESGVGQRAAREAALVVGGCVAIPEQVGADWNDVMRSQGAVAVRSGIEFAELASGTSEPQESKSAGRKNGPEGATAADSVQTEDSPQLLSDVDRFLSRFVAYPSAHARVAHVLWLAHAHAMDAWESTPRLAFLSPEPGSGKTRALEVSELLVPRPIESINATPAYLFRKVSDSAGPPTILFDEIDTLFGPRAKENEEVRRILNAGHRRGAMAGRCVVRGKTVETEELPAYCAVAIARLGNLPDTILTRSVVIRMRRRAPSEQIEPYRRRVHAGEGHVLRDRLASMVRGMALAEARPVMPSGVEDRAADVWEALLAIADAAGGRWPVVAREAAVALVAAAAENTPSLGIRLLSDLRRLFDGADAMSTAAILAGLCALDEAPWGDLRGKAIDARRLANLLRPYDVRSKNVRIRESIQKGYARVDLVDAWERYLPPAAGSATSATGATNAETAGSGCSGATATQPLHATEPLHAQMSYARSSGRTSRPSSRHWLPRQPSGARRSR